MDLLETPLKITIALGSKQNNLEEFTFICLTVAYDP